jgi:L-2-hydroxyglutarate oxidase LhgO
MLYDYLIVGSGIIGMTIAYELKQQKKYLKIAVIDKEEDVAKNEEKLEGIYELQKRAEINKNQKENKNVK